MTTASRMLMASVGSVSILPSVQRLVAYYGISELASIPSSGPHGRLLKGDVLKWIEQNRLQRRPPQHQVDSGERIELKLPRSTLDSALAGMRDVKERRVLAEQFIAGRVEATLKKVLNTTDLRVKIQKAFGSSAQSKKSNRNSKQGLEVVVDLGKEINEIAPIPKPLKSLSVRDNDTLVDYLSGKHNMRAPSIQLYPSVEQDAGNVNGVDVLGLLSNTPSLYRPQTTRASVDIQIQVQVPSAIDVKSSTIQKTLQKNLVL
ncbi:hypothetical protein MIR68_003924 [Amoeboaphelidium protococcarum]|nr:hypothetical protein MIR68_003924 [Amoeboaphelidium protococcarum]